ncbi:MAG TPA: TonB family protein [Longimicrobium sp.]|nr:TonB family protein [Longimicrobium sp.]
MHALSRWTPVRAALLAAALLLGAAPLGAQEPDEQPVMLNQANLPRIINRAYPPRAGRRPPTTVDVTMKIRENGRVDSASVSIASTQDSVFNDAAAKVALQMRFRPAKLAGAAVPVWVTLPITFERSWSTSGEARDVQRDDRPMPSTLPRPRP